MKLRDYLYVKKIKNKEFAALIGATSSHVSSICHERLIPAEKLADLIEKHTHGCIKASFYNIKRAKRNLEISRKNLKKILDAEEIKLAEK